MQTLNGHLEPLTQGILHKTVERALESPFPFRHHARDFFIGATAEVIGADLITFNLRHFNWVKDVQVISPDEFVEQLEGQI